jgi:hypothetical protein
MAHLPEFNLTILYSAIYLNRIRIPWFADFDAPEKYGLARKLLSPFRS